MEEFNEDIDEETIRVVEACINNLRKSIDSAIDSGIRMDKDYNNGNGLSHQLDIESCSCELRMLGFCSYNQKLFDWNKRLQFDL